TGFRRRRRRRRHRGRRPHRRGPPAERTSHAAKRRPRPPRALPARTPELGRRTAWHRASKETARRAEKGHAALLGRSSVELAHRHAVHRLDGDELLALASTLVEADRSVTKREQGVVLALPHVGACVDVAAHLADDDVAGSNFFTAELLESAELGRAVATVLDRALSFFMCHRKFL